MRIKSLLVTAVFATAVLCSAGFVEAETTDNSAQIAQLQAKIQELSQQIATLQAQQSSSSSASSSAAASSTAWCHTFGKNLGYADSGSPEVLALHRALLRAGFSSAPDGDYIYAKATALAVATFQYRNGITPSGYVGLLTRAKLNAKYGCSVKPACTPNWQCVWSECANGYQTKVPKDLNNCGVTAGNDVACVAQAQSCGSTTPSITVTSPNGGEPWAQGSTQTITWTSTGLQSSDKITVRLSGAGLPSNSNYTFPCGSLDSTATSCPWTVPVALPSGNLYKISVYNNQFEKSPLYAQDSSDNTFTITAANEGFFQDAYYTCHDGSVFNVGGTISSCKSNSAWQSYANQSCQNKCSSATGNCGVNTFVVSTSCSASDQPSITITAPSMAETWKIGETHKITWSRAGQIPNNDTINVGLVTGNAPYNTLPDPQGTVIAVDTPASSGQYSWTVPADDIAPGNYKLCFWSGLNADGTPAVYGTSANYITIPSTETDTFTVSCRTSPSSVTTGQRMSWIAGGNNISSYATYQWSGDAAGTYWTSEATYTTAGTKTATLAVTSNGTTKTATCSVVVTTSASQPTITVTSPNSGTETWRVGETHTINWNSSLLQPTDHVAATLYVYNSSSSTALTSSFIGDNALQYTTYFNWTIPAATSNGTNIGDTSMRYKMYLSASRNGSVIATDFSDNYFSIATSGANDQTSSPNCLNIYNKINNAVQSNTSVTCGNSLYNANIDLNLDKFIDRADLEQFWVYYNQAKTLPGGTENWCQNELSRVYIGTCAVTSPAGGETWEVGKTYNINWLPDEIHGDTVDIRLARGGSWTLINRNIPKSQAFYSWTITQDLLNSLNNNANIAGKVYFIQVVDSGSQIDTSKLFSISPSATQPTITVTSPNNGTESWKVGETHNITWTSTGFTSAAKVDIGFAGSSTYDIATNLLNTGSYAWTVPNNVGSQKIGIRITEATTLMDLSDNYFTIAAAEVVQTIKPVVSVASASSGNILTLGTKNLIGQFTVSAGSQAVKVRRVIFNISNTGFGTTPAFSSVFISDGTSQISGSSCSASGAMVLCTLGNSYATDFAIAAGQTQTFNLFATVRGAVSSSSAAASISSSLTSSGFIWDDTSTNGTSGVGLNGSSITSFPTNKYTVSTSGQSAFSNNSQDSLASISGALNAIAQQLRALMGQ